MTIDVSGDRLGLGRLLASALRLARRRWSTLLGLLICLHWAPRVIMTLFGSHYALGSRDPGAIASYGLQTMAIALCSSLMQASAVAVGLVDGGGPASPDAAITQVLRRLPALGPWWLLIIIPSAMTVWLRWSVHTGVEFSGTYYWRELGSTVYFIAFDVLLGLYPIVVLGDRLSIRSSLSRTLKLMSEGRGAVLVLVAVTEIGFLILNLTLPYAQGLAVNLGLGVVGYHGAYFIYVFVWDATAVIVNLTWVQMYRELVRAHDGVAPGELAHIFA